MPFHNTSMHKPQTSEKENTAIAECWKNLSGKILTTGSVLAESCHLPLVNMESQSLVKLLLNFVVKPLSKIKGTMDATSDETSKNL